MPKKVNLQLCSSLASGYIQTMEYRYLVINLIIYLSPSHIQFNIRLYFIPLFDELDLYSKNNQYSITFSQQHDIW